MDPGRLKKLLAEVKAGETSVDDALTRLKTLPFEIVGDRARLDHHRELRVGTPEVVFGESKTAVDIADLMSRLASGGGGSMATRVDSEKAAEVVKNCPRAVYHSDARVLVIPAEAPRLRGRGTIGVVTAGTSDRPVAAEAAVSAEFFGHEVRRFDDIGIAGLQRALSAANELREMEVIIAVAGMEGALPSVLAGLVDRPIIAVPTSIGYGVGLGGFVAMLSMLASCSPGVTVVNIDNGFGAAVAAARVNLLRES